MRRTWSSMASARRGPQSFAGRNSGGRAKKLRRDKISRLRFLSAWKLMRWRSRSPRTESQAAKGFARSASGLQQNRKSRIMAYQRKADADNPEWTRADFVKAKPPEDVLPADVLARLSKHRGPQKAPRKVPVSIRLSPVVVTHFKNQGPGWQARIDAALTKIVKNEKRSAAARTGKAG